MVIHNAGELNRSDDQRAPTLGVQFRFNISLVLPRGRAILGQMSVPPAVAGGSTAALTRMAIIDPPATAGGTDI